MIEGQMSIYDFLENNSYDVLLTKLKKYDIDNIYIEKFKGKQANFYTIYEELIKNKNYDEYITILYEELKKYVEPVEDARDYDLWKVGKAVMSLDLCIDRKHNCITILVPEDKENYNKHPFYHKSCGPYFCLSMIPKRILTRRKQ